MLKAISTAVIVAQLFPAAPPGVSALDAAARAGGNRKAVAIAIGRAVFRTRWPAQVLNVYVDGVGTHEIAGLRVSGAHFHHSLTRAEFAEEIAALVKRTFAASSVEEVDAWASVPLRVGKDVVVAGDLARPSARTVFTISTRRSEPNAALVRRIRTGEGVFWDQEWARSALK